MQMALIVWTKGTDDEHLKRALRQFVKDNTLLINAAELRRVADGGDLGRDERTTTLQLVEIIGTLY